MTGTTQLETTDVFKGSGAGPSTSFIPAPGYIDARVLAASTAEDHTVPSGMKFVVFSATADFYARYDATAAVPAADNELGTASELNPTARSLTGVSSISLISPTANNVVTMAFYK